MTESEAEALPEFRLTADYDYEEQVQSISLKLQAMAAMPSNPTYNRDTYIRWMRLCTCECSKTVILKLYKNS